MNTRKRRSVPLPQHAPQPSVGGEVLVPENLRKDAKDVVCEQLMQGLPLHEICAMDMMPKESMVLRWVHTDKGFKDNFLGALRTRMLLESHNLTAIADGRERKVKICDEDGNVISEEYLQEETKRAKLRIDTRLKLLEKLEPEVFGAKVETTLGLNDELTQQLGDTEVVARLIGLLDTARKRASGAISDGGDGSVGASSGAAE